MRSTPADIAGMTNPVRCAHCGGIYDLGTVEVTARYADCSMWKSPCCKRVVDDRGETGWKSTKDYYVIDKAIGNDGRSWIDPHGYPTRQGW